jgi:hypothetical protein
MLRALFVCTAVAALLAAGCEPPGDSATSETQDRLVGTWLREYEEDGTQVRRVLVLDQDGSFQEMSRTVGPEQAGIQHEHAGHWVFDGTNLKRRYTRIDGKPAAAPAMPYAAFQLQFKSSHEFTGVDNVRHHEVRYRRVADGTQP